jgi:hypothetical protein
VSIATALNVTATGVIHAGPCNLIRLIAVTPGTSGNLTVNDAATLGAANAGNVIFSVNNSQAQSQALMNLDWPCLNGIVISSIPATGVVAMSYNY